MGGKQCLFDVEGLRQFAEMKPPGPAETREHAIPGIRPLLQRHHAQGLGHMVIGHGQNTLRSGFQAAAEGVSQRAEGGVGRGWIQGELATERLIRRQSAKDDVGIGDGGRGAPLAIAGGSGPRARGGRTDKQGPAGVEAGEGPSTGPNGMHGNHGHGHGIGANAALMGELGGAVDQGDVRGRAAHVEAQDPGEGEVLGQGGEPRHAAGGPGQKQLHGETGRIGGGDGAPMGGHDGQARRAEARLEALQVGCHEGAKAGVEPGG